MAAAQSTDLPEMTWTLPGCCHGRVVKQSRAWANLAGGGKAGARRHDMGTGAADSNGLTGQSRGVFLPTRATIACCWRKKPFLAAGRGAVSLATGGGNCRAPRTSGCGKCIDGDWGGGDDMPPWKLICDLPPCGGAPSLVCPLFFVSSRCRELYLDDLDQSPSAQPALAMSP